MLLLLLGLLLQLNLLRRGPAGGGRLGAWWLLRWSHAMLLLDRLSLLDFVTVFDLSKGSRSKGICRSSCGRRWMGPPLLLLLLLLWLRRATMVRRLLGYRLALLLGLLLLLLLLYLWLLVRLLRRRSTIRLHLLLRLLTLLLRRGNVLLLLWRVLLRWNTT